MEKNFLQYSSLVYNSKFFKNFITDVSKGSQLNINTLGLNYKTPVSGGKSQIVNKQTNGES